MPGAPRHGSVREGLPHTAAASGANAQTLRGRWVFSLSRRAAGRDLPVPAREACLRERGLRPRGAAAVLATDEPLRVAFRGCENVGAPGESLSRLDSPARIPSVDASRPPGERLAHDSGPRWFALLGSVFRASRRHRNPGSCSIPHLRASGRGSKRPDYAVRPIDLSAGPVEDSHLQAGAPSAGRTRKRAGFVRTPPEYVLVGRCCRLGAPLRPAVVLGYALRNLLDVAR